MEERLQKYLAEAGIASRRKCEEFIKQGRVKVNGITATLGTKVNSETDTVEFDSKVIKKTNTAHTYILLNKPIDYVTTAKDQFNRPTVLDLVKTNKRLVPVGRLDMYTSGALILTDDGDFIYKITHPKHEITKTYTVTIKGIVSKEDVKKLPPLDTLRILAFNDKGREYLHNMRKKEVAIASRFAKVPLPYREMEYKTTLFYSSIFAEEKRKELLSKEVGGALYIK